MKTSLIFIQLTDIKLQVDYFAHAEKWATELEDEKGCIAEQFYAAILGWA